MINKLCTICRDILPAAALDLKSRTDMLEALAQSLGVELDYTRHISRGKLIKELIYHSPEADEIIGHWELKTEARHAASRNDYGLAIDLYYRCIHILSKDPYSTAKREIKSIEKKIAKLKNWRDEISPEELEQPGFGEYLLQRKSRNVMVIKCDECGTPVPFGERPLYCTKCGKQVL